MGKFSTVFSNKHVLNRQSVSMRLASRLFDRLRSDTRHRTNHGIINQPIRARNGSIVCPPLHTPPAGLDWMTMLGVDWLTMPGVDWLTMPGVDWLTILVVDWLTMPGVDWLTGQLGHGVPMVSHNYRRPR